MEAISKEVQNMLSAEQAWDYGVVPVKLENDQLHLKHSSKMTDDLVAELEIILGYELVLQEESDESITNYLQKFYRKSELKKEASVISAGNDLLDNIILESKDLGSSDIHIEVYESYCRIRIRIDGRLIERYRLNRSEYPSFINKVKIKSNLDIAEKRLPQDGRIFYQSGEHKFDIRVSVLPTLYGEKVVMRILSNDATNIFIDQLGFEEDELQNYMDGVTQPNGIMLISGPTGSGKTTTLYATLKELNTEETNIVTVEDPIEYTLPGINQVQLKEAIGLDFSAALKTFLRQDPDIIMLGEIRDPETANMAVRAAMTGHLVLSTIHTNSAWGTVGRLIDMGIPAYMIASTLNTSVAQRLVRKLCSCKKKANPKEDKSLKRLGLENELEVVYEPVGCEKCFHTGYSGRKAIYEVIPMSKDLKRRIKAMELNIEEELKELGIRSLRDNAWNLLKDGITSVEELYPLLMNE